MLVANTLLLLGSVLGVILHFLLVALFLRKRDRTELDWLFLASFTTAGSWHTASAIAFFYRINTGLESTRVLDVLDLIARAGQSLAPVLFLHVTLVWTGRRRWLAIPGYAVTIAMWILSDENGGNQIVMVQGVLFAGSAVGFLLKRKPVPDAVTRRFWRFFGGALAVPGCTLLATDNSTLFVWATLLPPVCLTYFVYRYDFLGLLIRRRVMFALRVGIFLAAYLFLVRRAADFIEDEYDFLGPLTEVALIVAAALVWLPISGWISRFLSKRTQLYDNFSKHLIQEAARILDIEGRLRFLANEVGQTFDLRRVLLVTADQPLRRGSFPIDEVEAPKESIDRLIALARKTEGDFWHSHATRDDQVRRILLDLGFSYGLPLWYEDHLTGLLLLDVTPRVYLDEEEPVLRGLARQISHSIENLHVVEEKIALEKTVLQQEHLAKLGKAATTIAHEVKNPLSSIKTLVQLMREDASVTGNYARDLKYIVGEIDRLNGSVKQLLSFSRPPAEITSDIHLSALLDGTLGALARHSEKAGVEIESYIDESVVLKQTNPELVQQIVLNLVLNAVQASPEGGKVCVSGRSEGDRHVSICIADEGPGIPPESQQRVFEPFFTTKQKGTGLGLAIVQKNIQQLRGEIQIESPLVGGRGTRMKLTLPLKR